MKQTAVEWLVDKLLWQNLKRNKLTICLFKILFVSLHINKTKSYEHITFN